MSQLYQLDDLPNCPVCNEPLDEGPAKDFVVWNRDNTPRPEPQDHDCGRCDATFIVFPRISKDKVEILFKA